MKRISQRLIFPIADFILTHCAFVGALALRFEGAIPPQYFNAYIKYGLFLSVAAIVVFAFFRLYTNLWQYVSIYELGNIFMAVTVFAIINYLFFMFVPESLPRSVFILIWGMMLFFTGGTRISR